MTTKGPRQVARDAISTGGPLRRYPLKSGSMAPLEGAAP